ncbi:MFS transporter [Frankia sp. R82]|uniref:MFS transporter n=1 Tax=Frankia sp. R82 TaxID=2950553 RepID=UPI002043D66C|nr:MFS transporter [Frankia sp. R82]MCM3886594.1 MFS transporter [Frankia sp. R82]
MTSTSRPPGVETTHGPDPVTSNGLPARRRQVVLGICCLSVFVVAMDATILNVGLPSIRSDLHATDARLQWTVDAYSLVLASLLLLAGSMGDRFGRRRVFRTGLTLFSVGSLLCSLAPGLGWLIVFRMIQAVGGSMLNPVALAIITNTFTDRRERARAIGLWAAVVGLSLALGPVLGGLLIDTVGWRSIFWINVPVGVLAVALSGRYVPESRAPRARRFDPAGQALVASTFVALVFAIIEAPDAGWTAPRTGAAFGVAALALAGLVWCEKRRADPLLDPRFFRSAPFCGATAIAVCGYATMGGFLFLNTLYLQAVRGYSAMHAGLLTLPMAAIAAATSPFSGRLVARHGPRPALVLAGIAIPASGVILLSFLGTGSGLAPVICAYVLFGAGFGMVSAPTTNVAVSGMPLAQAGVAGALAGTSRQLGLSLGVAVFGSVAAHHGAGGPGTATIDPTSGAPWWIMICCGLAIAALGVLTTGRWAQDTAARTAALLTAHPAPTRRPPGPS